MVLVSGAPGAGASPTTLQNSGAHCALKSSTVIAASNPLHQAFWWNGELWQYTRAPFGLKNMPAHFQRIMDAAIFEAGLTHCCCAFLDDTCVFSDTFEEHLVHLESVLRMLHSNGLRAHKSIFGCQVLEYLGHDVSAYGITPNEAKVHAIKNLPRPTCLEALRRALGFCGYYRIYVPHYSEISKPLTALTGKNVPFVWGEEHETAWEKLKAALCHPGNALKRADPSRPYFFFSRGKPYRRNPSETGTRTKDKERTERTRNLRGEGQDTRLLGLQPTEQAEETEPETEAGNTTPCDPHQSWWDHGCGKHNRKKQNWEPRRRQESLQAGPLYVDPEAPNWSTTYPPAPLQPMPPTLPRCSSSFLPQGRAMQAVRERSGRWAVAPTL